MAEFPALPLWTDALIADTTHLSAAEFGAYMRLLIAAWRFPGCCLPNDDIRLGQITGNARDWPRIRTRVMEFWKLNEDGNLIQKRLSREYVYVQRTTQKLSDLNRSKALKSWDVRRAAALPEQSRGIPPIPIPIKKEENGSPMKEERKEENGARYYAKMDSQQWWKWDAYLKSQGKPGALRDRAGGWFFPAEWPPGHVEVRA